MAQAVPFFRPDIGEGEIREVVSVLRSGWLTTGPVVARFERAFADEVGALHALAVNSCTAALHLAVHALGLQQDQGVLVPTMTFAATAEVVRYAGAIPVLVDCDVECGHLDLDAAARVLSGDDAARGAPDRVVGLMPVHVGGHMLDVEAVQRLADRWGVWVVEDAAHAFPAAWRKSPTQPWRRCGEGTADVTCFSFYANKTITTGEGGMVTTERADLAERMRLLSLHGLSRGAWSRYERGGSWDYQIVDAGYKYNLTDVAAAIGVHQARAEAMRCQRQRIAERYRDAFAGIDELGLPLAPADRVHAWHLFPLTLCLERLDLDRNAFIDALKQRGITPSVHWRPLHMHPYYQQTFGYRPDDCPNAAARFARTVSLPIFSAMTGAEMDHVIASVADIVTRHRRHAAGRSARRVSSAAASRA